MKAGMIQFLKIIMVCAACIAVITAIVLAVQWMIS